MWKKSMMFWNKREEYVSKKEQWALCQISVIVQHSRVSNFAPVSITWFIKVYVRVTLKDQYKGSGKDESRIIL